MKNTVALKENRIFRNLYGGKSKVTPEFVLYYKKNKLTFNRLGITVSKKIGHAVIPFQNKKSFLNLNREDWND